jgi:nucleoside-diphosphate-sugar epimerase
VADAFVVAGAEAEVPSGGHEPHPGAVADSRQRVLSSIVDHDDAGEVGDGKGVQHRRKHTRRVVGDGDDGDVVEPRSVLCHATGHHARVHLEGRRVAITGARGFVAGHLARRLVSMGASVSLLSRGEADPAAAAPMQSVDYLDPASLGEVLDRVRPSIVFHLAGFTHIGASWDAPGACVRATTEVTANVASSCAKAGVERLVYVSTGDVYGPGDAPRLETDAVHPVTPYGVASLAAEQLCFLYRETAGLWVTVVRPFNIYGPGQGADKPVPLLLRAGLSGDRLPMTSGKQTRDFLYVDDAVEALVAVASSEGSDGEVYNVCSGVETEVRAVADAVSSVLGREVADLGAVPHRPNEVWRHVGAPAKLCRLTPWLPRVSLRDGIAVTAEAAKETPWL